MNRDARPARAAGYLDAECSAALGSVRDVSDQINDAWESTLDDLDRRYAASRAMGGDERLAKHRAAGKLDARARVETLLDPGTFREIGTLTGGEVPADAVVAGSGLIDGRPVLVGAC